ncbi:FkbM family methyltransferase [Pseudomonas sp. NPDC089752]|uniref:FkbM family methyltransferase n=1 Tax=Pseudomonas sp. NPDC089752 TaxID=3364472 RepID=UPI00381EEB79
MPITDITPFRQLTRAYTALLNINHAVVNFQTLQRDAIREGMVGVENALVGVQGAISEMARSATPPVELPVRDIALHDRLGLSLLLDNSSLVDRCVIESGTWEADQLAYIAQLTELFRKFDKPLFLDIGSYWGLYSFLAMKSGVFAEQFAFEADRHNFSQLQANMFLNKAGGRITAINNAVSEARAVLRFRDSTTHPEGNRAGASVIGWDEAFEGYEVDAIPIDAVISHTGRHILMKLDVEGHEAQVLRGMRQTVLNNKVVLQVEVFDQHADQVMVEVEKLGLRTIHAIYPDRYLTNMTDAELGLVSPAAMLAQDSEVAATV